MAKTSVKGGFHLMWGLVISSIITAVGTILIARLLAPNQYGLYTIAISAPNLFQNFKDWGTSSGIIKFTSQYKAENNFAKVKQIIYSGLIFQVAMSLVLATLTFIFSDFLATNIFQRPEIAGLLQVGSLSLLTGAFMSIVLTVNGTPTSAAQASFVGLEKMEYNSITLIIHSTLRTILTSALVLIGLGSSGAMTGYTISLIVAGLIGLLLLRKIYQNFPKISFEKLQILKNIKELIRYGLPLSAGTLTKNFLLQFYSVILAIYTTDTMIGNFFVAANFIVLLSFFATPIRVVMFPAFSKLDPKKDKETLNNVFRFSVKYGALLVVPATALVAALSKPAVFTLFGSQYETSPLFLSIFVLVNVYSAFGFLSVTSFLNGQSQTKLNMKLAVLTSAIGFPLALILTSQFSVTGLITSTLIAEIPSLIIGLYWIKKNYHITIDYKASIKIVLTSALAALLTYILVSQLTLASWLQLIIGTIFFIPIYTTSIILTKIVDRGDISNLKEMVKGLGPLQKFINPILNLLEKILKTLKL